MLREIGHFLRTTAELLPLQRRYSRAEFSDYVMARADAQGYASVRRELVGDLAGRVLEIGCGTGTMFEYYGQGARVTAVEPEEDFLALAAAKARSRVDTIEVAGGDGMNLTFGDATFDAVVLGLVLCSVPSAERVLSEARRVLKPGGRVRALDHVRSEEPLCGFLMDVGNPLWLRLNKQGCRWNRRTLAAIEAAGFQIDDVTAFKRFDTILPAFPMRRVQAHKDR